MSQDEAELGSLKAGGPLGEEKSTPESMSGFFKKSCPPVSCGDGIFCIFVYFGGFYNVVI